MLCFLCVDTHMQHIAVCYALWEYVCVCAHYLFAMVWSGLCVHTETVRQTDKQTYYDCRVCAASVKENGTAQTFSFLLSGAVPIGVLCRCWCACITACLCRCTFSVCAHRAYTANVASTPYTAAAYSRHFGQSFNQLAHATAYIQSDFLIFRWIFHQNLLYILQFPITTTTKTKKSIKYPYIWNIKQQSCYFKEKKN